MGLSHQQESECDDRHTSSDLLKSRTPRHWREPSRAGGSEVGAHTLAGMTLARFVEKHYADELRERKGGLRTAEKEIQRLTTGPVGRALGNVKLSELTEWRVRKYINERRDAGIGPGASTATWLASRTSGRARAGGSWSLAIILYGWRGASASRRIACDSWRLRTSLASSPSLSREPGGWQKSLCTPASGSAHCSV